MNDSLVRQGQICVEGHAPLHTDMELLGLPLDMALLMTSMESPVVEYTFSPKNRSKTGTPRVVRVKDGVITAAFFNDAIKEDTNEHN